MSDKEFLLWLYERLLFVHKEDENVDYMLKFRAIINALDPDTVTPNIRVTSEMD